MSSLDLAAPTSANHGSIQWYLVEEARLALVGLKGLGQWWLRRLEGVKVNGKKERWGKNEKKEMGLKKDGVEAWVEDSGGALLKKKKGATD
ncbi:hypothetical protein ACH5RR_040662 [Cinchona calisaya]|uniref:Uncharacterized protein n=1 Tax=Cinchona calisaya TaxID=153742 RepID=A0ABD2XUW4_9GENT